MRKEIFDSSKFIKLTPEFFKRDEIILISSAPEGDIYIRLYLHLLTLAVRCNGYIYSTGALVSCPTKTFDSFIEELACICRVNSEIINKAFDLYGKLALVECGDPNMDVCDTKEPYVYFLDAVDPEFMGE